MKIAFGCKIFKYVFYFFFLYLSTRVISNLLLITCLLIYLLTLSFFVCFELFVTFFLILCYNFLKQLTFFTRLFFKFILVTILCKKITFLILICPYFQFSMKDLTRKRKQILKFVQNRIKSNHQSP